MSKLTLYSIRVLIFLNIAVVLTVGRFVPLCDYNECDKNNPIFWGKLYANPVNFYTFYECTPDGLQLFDCPDGLIFPLCGERCEWDNGNSTTTTTTMEPSTAEPLTTEPLTMEPSTMEPSTMEPSTIKPSTVEVSTMESESTTPVNCWASIFANDGLKTWNAASLFCRQYGLSLVNVDSQGKYDCVLDLIKKTGLPDETNYWIGGNDIAAEGNFVWVSNGSPVDVFYPLGNAQPDNGGPGGNEDCVSLRKIFGSDVNPMHVMNDEHCDLKFFFICDVV